VGADYLIAADGAASGLRDTLGIALVGPRDLAHFVNVYFRADLSRWTASRPALLYWVAGPSAAGVFQPLDGRDRWLCQIAYDGTSEALAAYDPARCREWVRAAAGDPAVEAEILSVERWGLSAVLAERLVSGRVLLVGDAAHRIPPIGGFGLNTGIQGAHNLIWKLALVLRGSAAPSLLRTYEEERLAVARTNAERSLENTRLVQQINAAAAGSGPGLSPSEAVAASRRYGNFLGMELGFTYSGNAVIPDGTVPPAVADEVTDYAPTAHPGRRAPHVWLEHNGQPRVSTLDLFGSAFTLLAGPGGGPWADAARIVAARRGIEIVPHLVSAAGPPFAEQYGLGDGGAALIRPDGHVAYRSQAAPDPAEATRLLDAAVAAVLGL
jgi:hypothetical protein